MKKKLLLIIIYLAVSFFSSCGAKKPPIKIGVNSWPPCEIWYIAEKMGYFKDTPVVLVRFSSWTDNMISLYKGNVDITHSTYFNAVYFSDKGEEGQIILSSDTITGSDGLVIKKNIGKGENLKGKRIAVEVNTDEHFLLNKALSKYSLVEKDVIIISATSKKAKEKFIKGEVDACFTYEPYLSEAAKKGGGKIIFTTKDVPGYMIDTLVARKKVIVEREASLKKIISAWYRAQKYIRENPDKVYSIMAEKEKMEEKSFRQFYGYFTFFTLKENRTIFSSPDFINKLEEMNEFLFKNRAIKEKINVKDIYSKKIISDL